MGKLIVQPRQDDPTSIVRAIAHLDSKLNTDAKPTWAGGTIDGDLSVSGDFDLEGVVTFDALTASRLAATNASKELVSADLYAWMVGTTNQVIVTDDGDGTVTLSTPQDIHTGASPTFLSANLECVNFDLEPTCGTAEGRLKWNVDDGTLELGMPGGSVNAQLGQEMLVRVTNDEATTVVNGTPVYASGASGTNILIKRADADYALGVGFRTIGLVTEDITAGQKGYVTTEGFVRDFDTDAFPAAGTPAYLQVGGGIGIAPPAAPHAKLLVGFVTRKSAAVGEVYVSLRSLPNLNSMSDVSVATLAANDILAWNAANNYWENTSDPTLTSLTVTAPGIVNAQNFQHPSININAMTGNMLLNCDLGGIVAVNSSQTATAFQVLGGVDAALLYTDPLTDRVGIGTDSPDYKLHVAGEAGIDGHLTCKNFVDSGHYTGFPNQADTALSWDDVTYTLTLTAAADTIWINGVAYEIDTLTKQLTAPYEALTGLYWFWITAPGGVPQLNVSDAVPGFDKCLTATVYWNTTTSAGLLSDERHWFGRDQWMHEYLHETVGARYAHGLAGTFLDATFEIEHGEVYDEDIEHNIVLQTVASVLYHNGDNDWVWDVDTATPYKEVASNLQYNNGTTLTPATVNKYVNYWVFASGDEGNPIHIIIGTAQYTTLTGAQQEAVPSFGSLPSAEEKLIYRVTYKNSATIAHADTTDFRTSSVSGVTGYVPTDHGALAGLVDDDHTQYHNDARALAWQILNLDMGESV